MRTWLLRTSKSSIAQYGAKGVWPQRGAKDQTANPVNAVVTVHVECEVRMR